MSVPERGSETKPLITLEVWQLAVIVVGLLVLVGHFLLGVGLPTLGKQSLLIVLLLLVLVALLVLRSRKRRGAG